MYVTMAPWAKLKSLRSRSTLLYLTYLVHVPSVRLELGTLLYSSLGNVIINVKTVSKVRYLPYSSDNALKPSRILKC